jgi:hypothetical protein
MKISAQWLRIAIAALVITPFSALKPALADTYTIYDLGNDDGFYMVGLTASGAAVIYSSYCMFTNVSCYTTYVDGVPVDQSMTAPNLVYDDGVTCTSLAAGFDIDSNDERCNSGQIVFADMGDIDGKQRGIYTGPDSDPDFLPTGSLDGAFLNSSGDVLWDDGQADEFFEAVDTSPAPVPEPSSLLLLATGLVAFTIPIRRKIRP